MNPLCCIAPVSIDRDRSDNPVVGKAQSQLGFERNVRLGMNQVSSISGVEFSEANCEIEESEGGRESGKSVGGILYKWVNYGKGWRPRWFVLSEDGVLSYYKIHGPDKICVMGSRRGGKGGVKVIGDDSLRYVKRKASESYRIGSGFGGPGGGGNKQWKPFGEIHLKVCMFEFSSFCTLSVCFKFVTVCKMFPFVWNLCVCILVRIEEFE